MHADAYDSPTIAADRLALCSPTVSLRDEMIAVAEEFRLAGERYLQDQRLLMASDFAGYVRLLAGHACGVGLQPGWVPYSTYWLLLDGCTVVGISSLRHHLTPTLEDLGGHIGYMIRPSYRRRGCGTAILALTLAKAHARHLGRVLVTCDSDNAGSARIIEKNGGRLASQSYTPLNHKEVRRYWIDLRPVTAFP
ncbi:MAG: GNAT family N-acetyltransferase [Anaerolineae bacterium]